MELTNVERIIKSEPLHIQAYHIIKAQILRGGFPPGSRIIESKLADKLGVSRGPTREALRMLTQDGLLVQKRGAISLFKPTEKNIIDICKCRESLEILAIQLSIINITHDEENKLKDIIKKSKELQKQGLYNELGKLDELFHNIIIKSARNEQLVQLMDVIKSKVIFMMGFILHKNDYLPPLKQHEAILEAILNKDEEDAVKHMKLHLKYSLDNLLENQNNF